MIWQRIVPFIYIVSVEQPGLLRLEKVSVTDSLADLTAHGIVATSLVTAENDLLVDSIQRTLAEESSLASSFSRRRSLRKKFRKTLSDSDELEYEPVISAVI